VTRSGQFRFNPRSDTYFVGAAEVLGLGLRASVAVVARVRMDDDIDIDFEPVPSEFSLRAPDF